MFKIVKIGDIDTIFEVLTELTWTKVVERCELIVNRQKYQKNIKKYLAGKNVQFVPLSPHPPPYLM